MLKIIENPKNDPKIKEINCLIGEYNTLKFQYITAQYTPGALNRGHKQRVKKSRQKIAEQAEPIIKKLKILLQKKTEGT